MRPTKIRASPFSPIAGAAALALLAGCDADAPAPMAVPGQAAPSEDCLSAVWGTQPRRDEAFDRANDKVAGGRISCATDTSPAQFRDAIAALKQAAAGDRAAMLSEIRFPLLYIDAAGTSHTLDAAAIGERFDEIFDPRTRALIERITLSQITVVPDQGGFFELGAVWLVAPSPGARPRLATVNHQALAEAGVAKSHSSSAFSTVWPL